MSKGLTVDGGHAKLRVSQRASLRGQSALQSQKRPVLVRMYRKGVFW